MNTAAVVLAHNEGTYLPHTLRILNKRKRQGLINHIIVVDDGSTDNGLTSRIARESGAEVVRLETNVGRRMGFVTGVKAAHRAGAQAMLIVDADVLYFPASTLKQMLGGLASGKSLMTMPSTHERYWNAPKEAELKKPRNLQDSKWQGYEKITDPVFVGQRAINMNALAPLLNGNPKWIEYLTPPSTATATGKWGFESALHKLINKNRISMVKGPIFNRAMAAQDKGLHTGQDLAHFEIKQIAIARQKRATEIQAKRNETLLTKRKLIRR